MSSKNGSGFGQCGNPSRRDVMVGGTVMAAGALAAPAILRAQTVEGTLYIESWGGTYADAVKNYLIKPFQEKYGIEVEHRFFGNNAEQLAKLKSGKSRVDISFLSSSYVYRAGKEDLLQGIRLENVPNYEMMFDAFKTPAYDPWDPPRCISYFWGDQAIAYNEQMISETPTSWGALWNPDYKGRVSFYGVVPGPITNVALYLGQDPNNITDMDAIVAKLEELKPNLLKFWSSGAEQTQLFATGEVWIGDFWRGRVNNLRKDGHPIGYVQPKEGTMGWVDTMVVPTTCENQMAAEAFMNLALTPEIQQEFVLEGINYAPTGSKVQLNAEQEDMLGASKAILDRVVFPDYEYQAQQADEWNQIINTLKS